jgi:hypothetical protein
MNGRLEWPRVHATMRRYLDGLPNVDVEVVEFDPHAPDPLFDVLRTNVNHLGPNGLARAFQLPESSARIICNAVERSEATTLAEVCELQGLGKVTVEHLYQYVRTKPIPTLEPQISLFLTGAITVLPAHSCRLVPQPRPGPTTVIHAAFLSRMDTARPWSLG